MTLIRSVSHSGSCDRLFGAVESPNLAWAGDTAVRDDSVITNTGRSDIIAEFKRVEP